MRGITKRSIRLINDQAYSVAVDGYDSLWQIQNQQQLMMSSIAPSWRNVGAEGTVLTGAPGKASTRE
jgi:hypothetical protein